MEGELDNSYWEIQGGLEIKLEGRRKGKEKCTCVLLHGFCLVLGLANFDVTLRSRLEFHFSNAIHSREARIKHQSGKARIGKSTSYRANI
ncbi:hypothetical protein PNOK_0646000 [Pyrrhoderma noxium]|uniref:Uncharacterized protein n=1 Tax=Pyrrhoderma noxium TaxID=2282107 RepID=A0A286UEQ1_9AGAM|nr:hypothetical protein PNOK_0646000 [Pyrrhoderma noxium]